MRPAAAFALALSISPVLSGCAAQIAGGGGVVASEERGVQGMWSGSASGAYVGRGHSVRAGGELTGRHEHGYGTSWHLGVQAGYVKNPEPDDHVGGSVYAEFGTPIRDGLLFPERSFYVGTTGEMLFWLYGDRDVTDINSAPWLLVQRPELVLMMRTRLHRDGDAPGNPLTWDNTIGLGLRLRLITEYF